jgi:hypothetical protein
MSLDLGEDGGCQWQEHIVEWAVTLQVRYPRNRERVRSHNLALILLSDRGIVFLCILRGNILLLKLQNSTHIRMYGPNLSLHVKDVLITLRFVHFVLLWLEVKGLPFHVFFPLKVTCVVCLNSSKICSFLQFSYFIRIFLDLARTLNPYWFDILPLTRSFRSFLSGECPSI